MKNAQALGIIAVVLAIICSCQAFAAREHLQAALFASFALLSYWGVVK